MRFKKLILDRLRPNRRLAKNRRFQRARLLTFDSLERRDLLSISVVGEGNPAPVISTASFPFRGVVQLGLHYDRDGDGIISSGDRMSYCSGALITDRVVLTAGHCVYDNKTKLIDGTANPDHGWTDNIFIHAGRDSRHHRPYGEAEMIAARAPAAWIAGGSESWKSDLGLIALDRNLGKFTGTFDYAAMPDTIWQAREYEPPTQPGVIAVSIPERVPFRPEVNILHYPAERGFNGEEQFSSTGKISDLNEFTIEYDKKNMWTTGGSSGSPIILDAQVDNVDFDRAIVGVHVRGVRVDPGISAPASATRLDAEWIEYIHDFIADHASNVVSDRPALVDYDHWFNTTDSSLSSSTVAVGKPVTINAKVFNEGTATATDIRVRFRLSTDDEYDSRDTVLGTATIASLAPFSSASAKLETNLPFVAAGDLHIVWAIDPDNSINEFDSPWNDVAVSVNSSGSGWVSSAGDLHSSNFGELPITVVNQAPIFATGTPSTVRAAQGELIEIDFDATDPEGRSVQWFLNTSSQSIGAQVNPVNGILRWEPGPFVAPGNYTLQVRASDGLQSGRKSVVVEVLDAKPRIGSLSSSVATIADDATVPVSLTANGVTSGIAGRAADRVEFYLDANGNGVLDLDANKDLMPDADRFLGHGSSSAGGFTWTGAIGGIQPGNVKVFARALRFSFSHSHWSEPQSATLQVVAAPPVTPVALPVEAHVNQQIAISQSGTENFVRAVTRDSSGNTYVFWEANEFVGPSQASTLVRRAKGRQFGPDGQPRGGEFLLADAAGLSNVAMRPNGEFVAIWSGGPGGIRGRRYSNDRTPIGNATTLVEATDSRTESIAVAADGTITLTWDQGGYYSEHSFARRLAWDFVSSGNVWTLSSGDNQLERLAEVAAAPDGRFVVVWQVWDAVAPFGSNAFVRGRLYGADGNPVGDEFTVNSSTGVTIDLAPDVSMNAAGEFVVSYRGRAEGDIEESVYARRYDAAGNPLGAEFRVNSSLVISSGPSAALSDSGWFVIVWHSPALDNGDGSFEFGEYAQVFDAAGKPRGPQFRLPTQTQFNQGDGQVNIDSDGDFFSAWIDGSPFPNRPSGSNRDQFQVFGRAFEVNLPPLLDAIGALQVPPGGTFTFTARATDPDGSSQQITYSLGSNAPQGATIDAATGVFQWTPSEDQYGGGFEVVIRAEDNGSPAGSTDQIVPLSFRFPDIIVQSATANGTTGLEVGYQIAEGPVPGFTLGFYRSSDGLLSADDTLLESVVVNSATDLATGAHTRSFTIGDGTGEIPLPGAGAADPGGDYRILIVADPAAVIWEEDQHPSDEDNTVGLSGAYHLPGGAVYVHGTSGVDQVAINRGSVVVSLNDQEWTYPESDVSEIRVWLGESDDTLTVTNFDKPIAAWGGPGDDQLSGGDSTDQLDGGPGMDQLLESPGDDQFVSDATDFAAPTVASIGTTTDTTPTISWTPVADAQSYEIVLETADGNGVVSIAGHTLTEFTWTDELAGGGYSVKVRAVDVNQLVTGWSNLVTFTVDVPIPVAPSMLKPTGVISSSHTEFAWSSVANADYYELRILRAADGSLVQQMSNLLATTLLFDGGLSEDTFVASVRAHNSDGEPSPWSADVEFTVNIPNPGKPILIAPLATIANASPTLIWSVPDFADKFEVVIDRTSEGSERSEVIHLTAFDPGEEHPAAVIPDLQLDPGEYAFRVRAVNEAGELGEWSETGEFAVDFGSLVPTAPTILYVPAADSDSSLDVIWTSESQAVTYDLRIDRVTDNDVVPILTKTGIKTSQITLPDTLTSGDYQVTVRSVNANGASPWSDPASFRDESTPADQDSDNVSDLTEGAAPNSGDGNDDGTPDSEQQHVASLPYSTANAYVTLAAAEHLSLKNVGLIPDVPTDGPSGFAFPFGLIDGRLEGMTVGEATVVTIFLDMPSTDVSFYKFGPTADNHEPHWYRFVFDSRSNTGAKILADRIEVHFVDGRRGDDDLQSNGVVLGSGAPAIDQRTRRWQNPELPNDVSDDGIIVPLDVLAVINELNSRTISDARGLLPVSRPVGSARFYDSNGDGFCTPQDALVVINFLNQSSAEGEFSGADFLLPGGLFAHANVAFQEWLPARPSSLGRQTFGNEERLQLQVTNGLPNSSIDAVLKECHPFVSGNDRQTELDEAIEALSLDLVELMK